MQSTDSYKNNDADWNNGDENKLSSVVSSQGCMLLFSFSPSESRQKSRKNSEVFNFKNERQQR